MGASTCIAWVLDRGVNNPLWAVDKLIWTPYMYQMCITRANDILAATTCVASQARVELNVSSTILNHMSSRNTRPEQSNCVVSPPS